MRIRQIHIRNFKGIKEATFGFHEQFTVLIGDNATGKTTLLDALAVALGGFLSGVGQPSRAIRKDEIRTVRHVGQPVPQFPVKVEAWGAIEGFGHDLHWYREIKNKSNSEQGLRSIRKVGKAMLQQARMPQAESPEARLALPLLAYFSTAQPAENFAIKFKQGEGVEMGYRNCLSARPSAKEFLGWAMALEHNVAKFDRPHELALLKAFKDTIVSLLPDQKWTQLAYDMVQDDLVGVFQDSQGEKMEVAYRQLSDGYRRVITFAADLAYRCLQLNPQLGERAIVDTPGVVLIDEIDQHLHPNWQRRIITDLKRVFPKVQFIATTHSPFIVQELAAEEMINLDHSGPHESPKDLTLHQVVTDIMSVNGIRSHSFAQRLEAARQEFAALPKALTLDDYQRISDKLGEVLDGEVHDPVYQAFMERTND